MTEDELSNFFASMMRLWPGKTPLREDGVLSEWAALLRKYEHYDAMAAVHRLASHQSKVPSLAVLLSTIQDEKRARHKEPELPRVPHWSEWSIESRTLAFEADLISERERLRETARKQAEHDQWPPEWLDKAFAKINATGPNEIRSWRRIRGEFMDISDFIPATERKGKAQHISELIGGIPWDSVDGKAAEIINRQLAGETIDAAQEDAEAIELARRFYRVLRPAVEVPA